MTTVNKSIDLRTLAINQSALVGQQGYQTMELAGYTYARNSVGGDLPSTFVAPIKTNIPVFHYSKIRVPGVYRVITGKRSYVYRTRDTFKKVATLIRFKTISRPPVKRAEARPDHPYSTLVVELFDPSAYTTYMYSGSQYYTQTVSGNRGQNTALLPAWNSNDDIALLGKLREKIAGSDFNAGVFYGEGLQSIRMIGDTAVTLAKSFAHAKRGNFRRAIEVATGGKYKLKNRAASKLLYWRYGVEPLLGDMKAAAEMAAHHFNTPAQFVVRVSRGAGGSHPTKGVETRFPTPYVESSAKHIIRKQIKASISEKNIVQLSGINDPLPVLWEWTPWSFVADWALPIGGWLHARGLVSAITGSFVTTSYEQQSTKGVKQSNHNNPSYYYNRIVMDRALSTTLSVPLPSIKPLAKSATWLHAQNAVALLITTFTSGEVNRVKPPRSRFII